MQQSVHEAAKYRDSSIALGSTARGSGQGDRGVASEGADSTK